MTVTSTRFTAYRSLFSFSVLVLGGTACSDDEGSSPTPVTDAGPDAAASETTTTEPASETSSSTSDAGSNMCASLLTACAGKDDVDGVGNLCLRAGSGQDEAACGVLHGTCLTYCETGVIPSSEAGAPSKEQCQAMGDACHDYDHGSGLGQLCHDVGHKANLVQCAALYDGCAALCDIHDGDAGSHHHDPDAADGSAAQQSFTLQFAAKVEGADFACGTQYTDVGSANSVITPMDLRFYVSNIRLITVDGEQVPFTIDDVAPFQSPAVALLDFEDGTGECRNGNSALNAQVTGTAAAGNYVGLAFSTSVPFDLNHADPTSLPAPLQPSDMSWGWLLGYKFVKAEVRQVLSASDADAGADAAVPMPGAGILHLGSTACQNTADASADMLVECAKPNRNDVVLDEFNPAENTIVLDVAQLFGQSDLSAMAMCHSGGAACGPMFTSLGVNYETGATLAEQAAFRVE